MTVNANLYSLFQQQFAARPSALLLTTAEGRSVSYSEADHAAGCIAAALLAQDTSVGDRVTVQVDKSVENLFLYLGCLRAGLVYHPLNPAYTASELAYFLDNAKPTVVVCSSDSASTVETLLASPDRADHCVRAVLTLDSDGQGSLMAAMTRVVSPADVAVCNGSDTAALLYSSGTTGQPKGIMLSHDNLSSNARVLVDLWGFTDADCLLHMLPIYHVHGLFVALGCVLLSGASMIWHAGYSDAEAIASLPRCTVMMGVPTYYTRLLSNPAFGVSCCNSMRLFVSGSAPLLADTFTEFERRCGHVLLERYGMTETGMNASNPLHGERRPGTVGLALPGVSLRVVDDEGRELEPGVTGSLQVRGPNVFSGYWQMPAKTAQDFSADGFFNTGDQAQLDADGYVSIVGRAKDMIISGGLNVYPREVEQVLDGFPDVVESAVVGVAHADLGEQVVAVLVVASTTPRVADLVQFCKQHLAGFKVPRRVVFVDALPRNVMGKVQKAVLREQCAD